MYYSELIELPFIVDRTIAIVKEAPATMMILTRSTVKKIMDGPYDLMARFLQS